MEYDHYLQSKKVNVLMRTIWIIDWLTRLNKISGKIITQKNEYDI